MNDKYPLKNKTEFQVFCIIMSIPFNLLLFLVFIFYTIAMLLNRDWSFFYGILGIILFGINTKSIFSLMDYPEE